MSESNTDRIEKQIMLNASSARVWRALTDHREFGEWFGVSLESPFVRGKTTRGRITHPGYEHLVMELVVQQMVSGQLFSFQWHPYAVDPAVDYSDEPPTLVEFRLEKAANSTLLILTESGIDALPAARRDEAFRMNSGGCAQQMNNIQAHVSSTP